MSCANLRVKNEPLPMQRASQAAAKLRTAVRDKVLVPTGTGEPTGTTMIRNEGIADFRVKNEPLPMQRASQAAAKLRTAVRDKVLVPTGTGEPTGTTMVRNEGIANLRLYPNTPQKPSSPRRRGSTRVSTISNADGLSVLSKYNFAKHYKYSKLMVSWIPACAGMTDNWGVIGKEYDH